MNTPLKDQMMLHVIVLVWGYTGVIGKWSSLEADQLVFLRMGIAFLALSAYLRSSLLKVPKVFIARFMGIGVLIALHWISFFAAISHSNVSVALACMASTSVFAALLEPIIYRRGIAPDEIITSLAASIGVVLIFGTAQGYSFGIGLALISSFLAAVFTILNGLMYRQSTESWAPKGGAAQMSAYEMLGGFLAIAVYEIIWGAPFVEWSLSAENIALALVLGILCTAIPFVGVIFVMRSISPFTACLTVNLEPVYAIVLALLHFGESEAMSSNFYGATILILGSVTLNGFLKSRTRPAVKDRESHCET